MFWKISMAESLPSDYFHDIYEQSDDPWNFTASPYEDLKYTDTLDSLPRSTYDSALEIGCSIGVLTARLAERCSSLLATDVSEKALAAARKRCQQFPNVRFKQSSVPADYPKGVFDLTVISEVAYYWSPEDLEKAANQIIAHMSAEGQLILVHWTPKVPDYPLTGDQVHDRFLQFTQLTHVHGNRAEKYRLDLFQKGSDLT